MTSGNTIFLVTVLGESSGKSTFMQLPEVHCDIAT